MLASCDGEIDSAYNSVRVHGENKEFYNCIMSLQLYTHSIIAT